MPAGSSSPVAGSAEPLISAAPPSGDAPSGRRARARTRWAVLRSRGRLVAEPGVALGPAVRFDITPGALVRLGAGAAIGEHTRIQVHAGEFQIGAHAVVGDRCVFELRTDSALGDHARLADEVVVLDHRPVSDDTERPLREQGVVAQPISIGAHVRIGPRAVVASGVSIGPRAQISAFAIIEQDVPADGRVEGRPVKPRAVPPPNGKRRLP